MQEDQPSNQEPMSNIDTNKETPVQQVNDNTDNKDFIDRTKAAPSESLFRTETDRDKRDKQNPLTMPSMSDEEVLDRLSKLPNHDNTKSVNGRKWLQSINDSMQLSTWGNVLSESLSDTNKQFRYNVSFNNKDLVPNYPRFKKDVNNLDGELAAMNTAKTLGLGALTSTPLWHSGIWLRIKPCDNRRYVALIKQLTKDTSEYGYKTYGLIYSNTTVFTAEILVDFILEHVWSHSGLSKEIDTNVLKNQVIKLTDLYPLIAAAASAAYPRGHRIERPCINTTGDCQHIESIIFNPDKALVVADNLLTPWQLSHMSTTAAQSHTLDAIKRYQNDIITAQSRRICIYEADTENDENVYITYKVPYLGEYFNAGRRWINGIVSQVEQTISKTTDITVRQAAVNRTAQASVMRNHAHWIESIEIGDMKYDDIDNIEAQLDILSAHDEIYEKFIKTVQEYIETVSIAIVGISKYECPKCGKENTATEEEMKIGTPNKELHKNYIPIDAINYFFVLITQRLLKLTER